MTFKVAFVSDAKKQEKNQQSEGAGLTIEQMLKCWKVRPIPALVRQQARRLDRLVSCSYTAEASTVSGDGAMANSELDRLRTQAEALSRADRATLVHDLLATLDGKPDPDAAVAWEQEIARRLAEIEQGSVKTISRVELSKRLRLRFR